MIQANIPFINATVKLGYQYEVSLVNQERICNDYEMTDFYMMCMSCNACSHPSDFIESYYEN